MPRAYTTQVHVQVVCSHKSIAARRVVLRVYNMRVPLHGLGRAHNHTSPSPHQPCAGIQIQQCAEAADLTQLCPAHSPIMLLQYLIPSEHYKHTRDFWVAGQDQPLTVLPDNAVLQRLVAAGQLPAKSNLSETVCTRTDSSRQGRPEWQAAPMDRRYWSALTCAGV